MPKMLKLLTLLFIVIKLLLGNVLANEVVMPNSLKSQVIDEINQAISSHYIDKQAEQKLISLSKRQYQKIKGDEQLSVAQFTQVIEQGLQQTTGNRHIQFYAKESVTIDKLMDDNQGKLLTSEHAIEIEFITPQLGYIRLNKLTQNEPDKRTIKLAFNKLAAARAIIIDIRGLSTVDVDQASFFLSHLLPKNKELATFISDQFNEPKQLSTEDVLDSQRIAAHTSLYVLTSPFLAQGAELIAFNLQQYDRALVIGKPTMGVASWQKAFTIANSFVLELPVAQAVHFGLGKHAGISWEGEGVYPDIDSEMSHSLKVATRLATKQTIR